MARSQVGVTWYEPGIGSSGSSLVLPARNIAAGSLVIIAWKYDGTAAATGVTSSLGDTYTFVESGPSTPTVGIAYLHNHPARTGAVITVALSGLRAYRSIAAVEYDGDATFDPLDGTITGEGDWSQSKTAAGNGLMIGVFAHDGTSYTPTSPLASLRTENYFHFAAGAYTGSGSKTVEATGGTAPIRSMAALFLDAAVSGGSSTSLSVDQGTFSLSGQATTFQVGRTLTSAEGTFSLSGQAVTFNRGINLDAAYGSFSLAGQDATLTYLEYGDFSLSCDAGTFTVDGGETYADYGMNAAYGTLSLSGQDAAFILENPEVLTLPADAGTFTLSGKAAQLRWSGAPVATSKQTGLHMAVRIGL